MSGSGSGSLSEAFLAFRSLIGLGSNPGGSAGGAPGHALFLTVVEWLAYLPGGAG